ncbi:hypothetical protein ACQPZP_14510 [Spirillospora sp. CA-142024]|uniref:hypothetical protein n=1 Tax=Spirillospora sp. CA-142024 TaxID=3240036 RepID=UPI003D92FE72
MSTEPTHPGPYETEQQAAEMTRDAYGHPDFPGHMKAYNRARLTQACESAGVELGAYDLRILEWLSVWEPEVIAVVAGMIVRASCTTVGKSATWPDGEPEAVRDLADREETGR